MKKCTIRFVHNLISGDSAMEKGSNELKLVIKRTLGGKSRWGNRSDSVLNELNLMPDVTVPTITEMVDIMKR